MLENYRISSEITRTQNCRLLLAQHAQTGQKVVLKTLLPQLDDDGLSFEERLQRFRRECNIHRYLRHDSIVEALDYFEHENQPYLVTAYKPYPTLKELLQQKTLFSPIEALNVVQQLCQALHYIHDQGIIHRDVHPDNIMITEENRIFLIDFGCARKVFAPGVTQDTLLKGERYFQGTFYYMSPEQFIGESELDFRTDVFSMGVILFQLLTGHLPFEGAALTETMENLVTRSTAPHSLVEQNPYVPQALEDMVFQTLKKDPDYRTPTARKLALEIELLLTHTELYFGEARWHLEQNKNKDTAQEYILLTLQKDAQHLPALKLLGALCMQQKNWAQARRCYGRILELNPSDVEARIQMGHIEQAEGYYSCAAKAYLRALEQDSARQDIHLALAQALYHDDRPEEAMAYLQPLIAEAEGMNATPEALELAGDIYREQTQNELALACYEKLMLLCPKHLRALSHLAQVQHELGRYLEAIMSYRKLQAQDNTVQVQHNLANVYYQTGELGEARLILENLIETHNHPRDKRWEMSYRLLAFVYSRLSLHEDAIEMYKYAILSHPEHVENYLFLAAAYREQLHLEDALSTLKYVAELPSGQPEAMVYFLMARAYYEQGKEQETIHALEQCLSCKQTLTANMERQASEDLDLLYERQRVRLKKQRITRFRQKESSTVRDYSRQTSIRTLNLPGVSDYFG